MKFRDYQRPFQIGGVPVLTHWSLTALLVVGLVPAFFFNFVVLLGVMSFILMLFIHELGHFVVARGHGYCVHEIRLYPFHGVCVYETPDSGADDAKIAISGPAAQLLVAIPLLYYYETVEPQSIYAQTVIAVLGSFALIMALLNLLPVAGFDGEKIWVARRKKNLPKPRKKTPKLRVVNRDVYSETKNNQKGPN